MATKGEIHYNQEFKAYTTHGHKYAYGTTDRYAGDSVYIYYKPAMQISQKINVTDVERKITSKLRALMNKVVLEYPEFNKSYILDFQFSNKVFTPGIKSKLSLEVFLSTVNKFKSPDVHKNALSAISNLLIGHIDEEIKDFAAIYG